MQSSTYTARRLGCLPGFIWRRQFCRQGIYDVDAFRRSLNDKVPENRLLSHDLFEALQSRCGLVTDVILFEDYPPHYLAYTDRLNRWVARRLAAPAMAGRWSPPDRRLARNTLSPIDRWRILDNLRRVCYPFRSLPCLSLPGVFAWSKMTWTLIGLAPYMFPY